MSLARLTGKCYLYGVGAGTGYECRFAEKITVVQCNLEKVCLFRSQGGLCFNHGHQIVFQYFLDGALVNEFFIVFGKVIQENRVEVVCIKKHRKFKLLVVVQLEVFFLELTEPSPSEMASRDIESS